MPPPEFRTSGPELLGTTLGMILTAVVAIVGLGALLGIVFLADVQPGTKRLRLWRRGEAHGATPEGEISPGQGSQPWGRIEHRHVPEGGHPHGNAASWLVVAVIVAAFTAGGFSLVAHAWWVFWACAGVVVLCIPAGRLAGIMNNTISWGSTPAATEPDQDSGSGQIPGPGDASASGQQVSQPSHTGSESS